VAGLSWNQALLDQPLAPGPRDLRGGDRSARHFGRPAVAEADFPFGATAAAALARLDEE
jgi:hypothetical protein